MGILRKLARTKDRSELEKLLEDVERGTTRADLVVRDENEALQILEEQVRKQLRDLVAPSWSSESIRMLQYMYHTCSSHGWFDDWDHRSAILSMRTGLDHDVFPRGVPDENVLATTAGAINANVSLLVSTKVISDYVRAISPAAFELKLENSLRVQIRRNLSDFKHSKKNQNAAFLRSSGQLLVWHNDSDSLVALALQIEDAVLKTLWSEYCDVQVVSERGFDEIVLDEAKRPSEQDNECERPVQMLLPWMVSATILLNFIIIALACRNIVYETLRARNWAHLVFLLYFPFVFFLTSFFSLMLVVIVVNFVGPVSQLFENSKFYSCTPPVRITENLPHITIQCPVYKESLEDVIVPTVQSIRKAIATYERQGGTASIFINDDGLQLISPEERELRRTYYALNEIGWVARPAHGKNGFVRAGRFKKASNMNFAMDISLKVEMRLETTVRHEVWTDQDEDQAYDVALEEVLSSNLVNTGHEAWAAGNIRIGELILLIDSDTRVPVDCFLDAASEFRHSPQVAIVQHQSGVMQVVFDFWENAITYFTQCIYFSLQWATAAGDTAAFVGHNAFLRWSALQEVSNIDTETGKTKWWSESHVSEDFEMSLKLQTIGYVSRFATYSNNDFQEGVSLTCYDELLRWSKYAYGCSELVFNPFSKWLRRGPFTKIFKDFLLSDLNSFSKFTMLAYIGTYYAIALWPLLVLNYFVVGWYLYFTERAYKFYNEGYGVLLTVILIFNIISPIAAAASRYRAKNLPFWRSIYENFKWSIPLCIFLGGLSMHLSYALLAHLCDLNIQWGATAKTLESHNFFVEVPKIWAKFKHIYIVIFGLAVMQIYFALWAEPLDRIWGITANGPLIWLMVMHATAPLILNPCAYPSEWTSNLKPHVKAFANWFKSLFRSRKRLTSTCAKLDM